MDDPEIRLDWCAAREWGTSIRVTGMTGYAPGGPGEVGSPVDVPGKNYWLGLFSDWPCDE